MHLLWKKFACMPLGVDNLHMSMSRRSSSTSYSMFAKSAFAPYFSQNVSTNDGMVLRGL